MANDLLVRILGDTRGLERSFARANQATATFGRNVDTVGAKADRTTKKFAGLGRGVATGFGGAIAVTSSIEGIRSVATAAAESEQVLGQTKVALETTGKSWAQYGQIIEDTVQKQSRLGFDDEALLRTFSLFARSTEDVGEALRLNNLAMDVARARFIDLEQAAQLVNKAALGQSGALRRLGIDVAKGATAVELLTALTEKYGGAAEAASGDASTSFARTQVALENLQESIGTLILPALELLADNMQTVATFATNLTSALQRIGRVRIPEIEIPFVVTIGGQSVGDIAGGVLGKLKFTPLNPLFGLTIANEIANQFRDQAEAATPDLSKQIGDATEAMVADAIGAIPPFGLTKLPSETATSITQNIRGIIQGAKDVAAKALKDAEATVFTASLDALNLNLDKAAATRGIQDDLRVLDEIQGLIRARIAKEGKTTDLMRLLFQADQERATILSDEAARAAAARKKTQQDLADAAEERKRLIQAAEFRAIGLSATGGELIPGVENLRKQFEQLSDSVVGQEVPRKLLDRLKLVGKFLSSGIKSAEEPTRAAIRDLFQAIRQEFEKGTKDGGPLTATSSLNAKKIVEGLGLGPEQERELRARLSSFNTAGQALARGGNRPTGGFVSSAPIVVESHTTVQLDSDTVGRSVTKQQQKQRRRNPKQKRGPNSGV